jgi:hypothetical protein
MLQGQSACTAVDPSPRRGGDRDDFALIKSPHLDKGERLC